MRLAEQLGWSILPKDTTPMYLSLLKLSDFLKYQYHYTINERTQDPRTVSPTSRPLHHKPPFEIKHKTLKPLLSNWKYSPKPFKGCNIMQLNCRNSFGKRCCPGLSFFMDVVLDYTLGQGRSLNLLYGTKYSTAGCMSLLGSNYEHIPSEGPTKHDFALTK